MIRLVWCCTSNPLGETKEKHFHTIWDCRKYIEARHIPADSAGYTAYLMAPGNLPKSIIDYRLKEVTHT